MHSWFDRSAEGDVGATTQIQVSLDVHEFAEAAVPSRSSWIGVNLRAMASGTFEDSKASVAEGAYFSLLSEAALDKC